MREPKYVYAHVPEKGKVLVGVFKYNLERGAWDFYKNKAHFMRVVNGYGIQRTVKTDTNVTIDMLEQFRRHPDIRVFIKDAGNGLVLVSEASEWVNNHHLANYGAGKQMFLSIDYMKNENE